MNIKELDKMARQSLVDEKDKKVLEMLSKQLRVVEEAKKDVEKANNALQYAENRYASMLKTPESFLSSTSSCVGSGTCTTSVLTGTVRWG